MQHNAAGKLDVNVVASLLAAIASLAAVAAAGLVAWELRQEGRATHLTARVEVLWHLNDQWNSSQMADARSAAAAGLLSGQPGAEVATVLDFFDEVALLMDHGTLDEELAALYFYWPLANYWAASGDYVLQIQREDPSAWQALAGLADRLGAAEMRRHRRREQNIRPSAAQVQQFLLDEQGDNQCNEDAEVGKTPA